MRNVSDKICRENQHRFRVQIFSSENRVVFVIMLKNMIQPDRPLMETHSACSLHAGNLGLQTHAHNT